MLCSAARAQHVSYHWLRRDRWMRRLRGKFADQSIGVGRHVIRRLEHQPLQRPMVGRDAPLQALLHPLHDQGVFFHPSDRVGALAWRQFGNMCETGIALAVEVEHARGAGEKGRRQTAECGDGFV